MRFFALLAVLFVLSSTLRAQAPDVMYLRFNEGVGTTTADQAVPGIGATPTLQGACGWNNPQAYLGASSLQPGPVAADALDTGVAVNLIGDWTVEFACIDTYMSTSFPTPQKDVFSDNTGAGFNNMRAYATNNLAGVFDFVFQPSATNSIYLGSVLPLSVWTQFSFVHDASASQITVYIDGVFHSTHTFTSAVPLVTSSGANLRIGGNSFDPWIGLVDEFRIWGTARTAAEVAANYNTEIVLYTNNVAVTSITAPTSPSGTCVLAGSTETVSCVIQNASSTAITAGTLIQVEFSIDGGLPVTEFALAPTGDLAAGASLPFTFNATADLSAPGSHILDVAVVVVGDQNPNDDSQSVTILSGGVGRVSSFPWTEDFDSLTGNGTTPPLGWAQESGDSSGTNSDWIFRSGQAGTASTSPIGDHTSGLGHYAFVEDSSANHSAVSLRTPCLDLSSLANPQLSFWFHSQDASAGLNSNPMSIDVIVQPAGTITMDVFGPEANIGNGWMARGADLSPFAGQTIQLVFRGRSDGGTAKNDTAIDDLRIFDPVPTSGQAPISGTAILDLNSATNGNGLAVSSFQNGPYFSSAQGGSSLAFQFEGETNRPFALLIGPLNPVSATYPNVGQLDIGGAVDPVSGIPASIQVLADGFNPTDFIDLLFNTGPSGQANMSFVAPVLPPGVVGTFQTLFSTGNGFFFAISNAIELTIL